MYSYFFVTHGSFGKTLVETASMILQKEFSERIRIFSVSYDMQQEMDAIQKQISKEMDIFLKKNHTVILFTDIFGGTPSNMAFTFSKKKSVDVIAGVNLPMVLSALERMNKDEPFEKVVEDILKSGNGNIVSAKKLMGYKEIQ